MLIDINKVIVNDRIRKDFGDIQELANDIQENGLINPPVVNTNYELLAGERRLKACKLLGWPQIEVRMMDTRDAEHELNIEISENDVRKGFTKTERVDYIKRLLRIEQAKAKERQDLGLKSDEGSRADDATAKQFGIGRDTMRREIAIVENRDLLDPADFADWDEGKLSTNKAFQRIKAAKELAEHERDMANAQRKATMQTLEETFLESEAMENEITSLKKQLADKSEPEIIERTVEVVPEDTRRHIADLELDKQRMDKDNAVLRKQLEKIRSELDRAKGILNMGESTREVQSDAEYLVAATNQYVRRYGGLTWTVERLSEIDETTLAELKSAVRNLATFSNALMNSLEDM